MMQLYRGFWLEHGTVIDTTLGIALMGPGSWIHRTKEITPEPAGEAHTLVITEDSPEPMMTLFVVQGVSSIWISQ